MANQATAWIISTALLLWGIAYLWLVSFAFFFATSEHWARLVDEGRIRLEYVEYIAAIPTWVVVASVATAVTRFSGGVALFFSPGWAFYLYTLSFLLTLVIMFRAFFFAGVASVIPSSQIAVEALFLFLSAFAVFFAFVLSR
ncbi:MAG: hypothetical protein AAGA95_06990 [Pseudomonadota bacterium]